jgi:hypothetical protein
VPAVREVGRDDGVVGAAGPLGLVDRALEVEAKVVVVIGAARRDSRAAELPVPLVPAVLVSLPPAPPALAPPCIVPAALNVPAWPAGAPEAPAAPLEAPLAPEFPAPEGLEEHAQINNPASEYTARSFIVRPMSAEEAVHSPKKRFTPSGSGKPFILLITKSNPNPWRSARLPTSVAASTALRRVRRHALGVVNEQRNADHQCHGSPNQRPAR